MATSYDRDHGLRRHEPDQADKLARSTAWALQERFECRRPPMAAGGMTDQGMLSFRLHAAEKSGFVAAMLCPFGCSHRLRAGAALESQFDLAAVQKILPDIFL